jgi:hypothetical protein
MLTVALFFHMVNRFSHTAARGALAAWCNALQSSDARTDALQSDRDKETET